MSNMPILFVNVSKHYHAWPKAILQLFHEVSATHTGSTHYIVSASKWRSMHYKNIYTRRDGLPALSQRGPSRQSESIFFGTMHWLPWCTIDNMLARAVGRRYHHR